jgi:adenylate kinase
MVRRRLEEHDWNYGFILDGFPRNHAQAEFFLESYDIDAVINIEVPDAVVLQRVLSRRLCSGCGVDYNLIHHRPSVANRCDMCSGVLVARADDTEETISKRIADFHTQTQPVLDLFSRKELIVTVDGTSTAEAVQQQIRLNLRLAPVPEAPLGAHAGSGPTARV